jgi:hypothetical protein
MSKNRLFVLVFCLAMALTAGAYGQKTPGPGGDDFGGGPGMYGEGGGPGMHGNGPGMMGEHEPGGWHRGMGFMNPDIEKIMESYRIKIQRVFLDTKEARINLDSKRKELFGKIKDLAARYQTDKSGKKDILDATKEVNSIQDQIQGINEKAMEKIRALNEDRKKEINSAREKWLSKLGSDDQEFEKYVNAINSRPPDMDKNRPYGGKDRNQKMDKGK